MLNHTFNLSMNNRLYQRKLGIALVTAYGVGSAIEICQMNGWQGVLDTLLDGHRREPYSECTAGVGK